MSDMSAMGKEAAVRASLDVALEDLLRAAVESRTEPDAESCARIDAVFDHRMASYRHLAWACAEIDALKHQLKVGLCGHRAATASRANGANYAAAGEPHR